MTDLARWLRRKLDERDLTLNAAAQYSKVGAATLSDILNHGHTPRDTTLLKLAAYFDTDPVLVFQMAGRLPDLGDEADLPAPVRELLSEFRAADASIQVLIVQAWRANLASITAASRLARSRADEPPA